jgi:phosphoribosyl 1,2-cyclic phosphodiesterase
LRSRLDADRVTVTFWGVRGSIPTPGYETSRYGGNTLCVELGLPGRERALVIDAGSGIRRMGDELLSRSRHKKGLEVDLLLSHTHLDHILGLPFFRPLYYPNTCITIYGPAISPTERLEQVIGGQMSYRYFPVRQIELAADISYVDLREGTHELGDGLVISSAYLNHPLLCMGYRIDYHGVSVCTAFDTEPFRNLFVTDPADPDYDEVMAREGEQAAGEANRRIREFFRRADLLIHDAQFTEAEYRAGRQGWGHSSIEQALAMAAATESRRIAMVHHDPGRTDSEMDDLADRHGGVRSLSGSEVIFAHEGLVLSI